MKSKRVLSQTILMLAVMALPSSGSAAVKKRARATSAARSQPKPTEVLAGHLVLNSIMGGEAPGTVCRRSNFKLLAVALEMNSGILNSTKGEFETTADFQERSGKLADALTQNPIVICEMVYDNPDIDFKYDADSSAFKGGFRENHNVWRDVKKLGSYRSKTRMGISATVKSSIEFEYNVSLDLPDNLRGCLATSYSGATFAAPASRESAPVLKARGTLAIIGRLVSPYVGKEENSGSPTLDEPYDVYTQTLTVYLKPERIVLLGPEGEIAWSCIPGRFNPALNPVLLTDPTSIVGFSDYPFSAYREKRSGVVAMQLKVGKDGTVSQCTVSDSSGSADLDAAGCDVAKRRAKFTPAADQDGNPQSGEYSMEVTFKPPY